MFKYYNANPGAKRSGDCVIRAISKLTGKTWEEIYIELCTYGLRLYDMPSSNPVWNTYLIEKGYKRHLITNKCPLCYTVSDFADDHKRGKYLLALNGHVLTVINGIYYDTWDSGDEVPFYYWEEEINV